MTFPSFPPGESQEDIERELEQLRAGDSDVRATGHVIADLLAGTEPRFPIHHYAPGRFGAMADDAEWLRQKISDSPSGNY